MITEGAFGDMDFIACRNVMIYFSQELKDMVLDNFGKSLHGGGFLWLGESESLFDRVANKEYSALASRYRLYRKNGG